MQPRIIVFNDGRAATLFSSELKPQKQANGEKSNTYGLESTGTTNRIIDFWLEASFAITTHVAVSHRNAGSRCHYCWIQRVCSYSRGTLPNATTIFEYLVGATARIRRGISTINIRWGSDLRRAQTLAISLGASGMLSRVDLPQKVLSKCTRSRSIQVITLAYQLLNELVPPRGFGCVSKKRLAEQRSRSLKIVACESGIVLTTTDSAATRSCSEAIR